MAKERGGEPRELAIVGDVLAVPRSRKEGKAPPPGISPPVPNAPATTTVDRRAPGRDIGIDVPKPTKTCADRHCPFHGTLPVRGQTFEGVVVSTKMQRTALVEREYLRWIRKYERYEKRTKRFRVHSPPCLELKEGDRIVLMECRPIAKTVSFVAIQNRGAA